MPETATRDPRLDEPYSPEELQKAGEWCSSHSLPVNQRGVADIAMLLRAEKLGLLDDLLERPMAGDVKRLSTNRGER